MMVCVNRKRAFFKSIAIMLVVLMVFGLVDTMLLTERVLAINGWDVLIYVGHALVGGAIFEFGKWALTSGAIASLTPAAATAVLAGLGVLGLIVYAVHVNSSGSEVDYYENHHGCISRDGGKTWICPNNVEELL